MSALKKVQIVTMTIASEECVSKLKSTYYLFLYLGTDYTESTDSTDVLYSFSVKTVLSV